MGTSASRTTGEADDAFFDAQGAETRITETTSSTTVGDGNEGDARALNGFGFFPQHLVHYLLLEYTSPHNTDALLMTCKLLYEQAPAVWRLRYEAMKREEPAVATTSVSTMAEAAAAATSTSSYETMDHQTHRRLAYEAFSRRGKVFLGKLEEKGVYIMHGHNTAHWIRHFPSCDSKSGYVAKLNSVCWFDLSADCCNVQPGEYNVYIRALVTSEDYGRER